MMEPRITRVLAGQGKDRAMALASNGRLYALRVDSRGHDVWTALPALPETDPPAAGILTDDDTHALAAFVRRVLGQVRIGDTEEQTAAAALLAIMGELSEGRLWRARQWFEEGTNRKTA